MEAIYINSTEDTPKVILNAVENKFELSERSYPEDAASFYNPILKWLEDYTNVANPDTHFEFKLEYFNTASSKQIFKIISVLKKIAASNQITISWYYHKMDKDMQKAGLRYSKLLKVPIELVEY